MVEPQNRQFADLWFLTDRFVTFGTIIHPWMQQQTLDSGSKRRVSFGSRHSTSILKVFLSPDQIEFCYSY